MKKKNQVIAVDYSTFYTEDNFEFPNSGETFREIYVNSEVFDYVINEEEVSKNLRDIMR